MADFASVGELEAFMATPNLGARGTAFLGYASAEIRRYTGLDLEATTGRQEEWSESYRAYLFLTETPVTAVSAVTVDAVAFTHFGWTRWGKLYRLDTASTPWWDTGPIVVTYDSGYAAGSDEMAQVKAICLEMCARALAGPTQDTFGPEIPELRGAAVNLFLTEQEQQRLDSLSAVPVG